MPVSDCRTFVEKLFQIDFQGTHNAVIKNKACIVKDAIYMCVCICVYIYIYKFIYYSNLPFSYYSQFTVIIFFDNSVTGYITLLCITIT